MMNAPTGFKRLGGELGDDNTIDGSLMELSPRSRHGAVALMGCQPPTTTVAC